MLLLILICLALAGWCRYAWWSPLAVFAVAIPLMLYQRMTVNEWRADSSLAPHGIDHFALTLAITCMLYVVAYGIGRAARRLFTGPAKPPPEPTPPAPDTTAEDLERAAKALGQVAAETRPQRSRLNKDVLKD